MQWEPTVGVIYKVCFRFKINFTVDSITVIVFPVY